MFRCIANWRFFPVYLAIFCASHGLFSLPPALASSDCKTVFNQDYQLFLQDLAALIMGPQELSRSNQNIYPVAQGLLQHPFVKQNWPLLQQKERFPLEQMANILSGLSRKRAMFQFASFGSSDFKNKFEQALLQLDPQLTDGLVDRSKEVALPDKSPLTPERIAKEIRAMSPEKAAEIGITITRKMLLNQKASTAGVQPNPTAHLQKSLPPILQRIPAPMPQYKLRRIASVERVSLAHPEWQPGTAVYIQSGSYRFVSNQAHLLHPSVLIRAFIQGEFGNRNPSEFIDFIIEMANLLVAAKNQFLSFDYQYNTSSLLPPDLPWEVATLVDTAAMQFGYPRVQYLQRDLYAQLILLFTEAQARSRVGYPKHDQYFDLAETLQFLIAKKNIETTFDDWDFSGSRYY